MAEELVGLTGLGVSAAQAEKIKALCNALDDYDRRAIEVHLRLQQPSLWGCLCSSWKQTGHTTEVQVRRYVQEHLYTCIKICVLQAPSLWGCRATEPIQELDSGDSMHPAEPEVS